MIERHYFRDQVTKIFGISYAVPLLELNSWEFFVYPLFLNEFSLLLQQRQAPLLIINASVLKYTIPTLSRIL